MGRQAPLERWGRYLGITAADLDRAEDFFARHGEAASFFGRMIPVIRSLVSFAAGISHMNLGKFTLFSFLGSLPWTALLVFAGVQLGANWESVGAWLKRFEYAIVAVLVVILVAWVCASSSPAPRRLSVATGRRAVRRDEVSVRDPPPSVRSRRTAVRPMGWWDMNTIRRTHTAICSPVWELAMLAALPATTVAGSRRTVPRLIPVDRLRAAPSSFPSRTGRTDGPANVRRVIYLVRTRQWSAVAAGSSRRASAGGRGLGRRLLQVYCGNAGTLIGAT
jgi:hypothetical protein